MNVAIFTDTFLPKIDGVAISVDHFCRYLSARGHKFIICCPKYGSDDIKMLGDDIEILRFKNAPLPSYPDIKVVLPSQKKIHKAIKEFKADLIHIQTPGLLGQYGVMASRMYDVPLVGTYHTLVSEQETYISLYRLLRLDRLMSYFQANKKIKKRLDKIERKDSKSLKKALIWKLTNSLYETSEIVISPSYLIRDELALHGMRKPIEVVSNGMDLKVFKGEIKEFSGRAPKLLHVGRISYEKNCEVVIKAFALILEKFPEATLDIVGDGPALESMKIEARQHDVYDKIKFPGFVPRDSLPDLYPKYDLFLTASTMETQGLVVLESMACGLPCVGVNSFALPELIQDGRNGFIVEPGHHIDMAQRALQILEDREMYRNFSEQSLAIAGEHDIGVCAQKLENTYKQAIETYKKKGPGLLRTITDPFGWLKNAAAVTEQAAEESSSEDKKKKD
ncbi:MAG: glycosyltransferase [Leptospiraceae bacterium]|nr:glycosyltransferase [Leptospiraceae bacterium]